MTAKKLVKKAYTKRGLSKALAMNYSTLCKRLDRLEPKVGKRVGYYYNPKQVGIIFENLEELMN